MYVFGIGVVILYFNYVIVLLCDRNVYVVIRGEFEEIIDILDVIFNIKLNVKVKDQLKYKCVVI